MNAETRTTQVLRAESREAEAVTEILGEAFACDPVSMWINPDTNWSHQYFNVLSGYFFRHGEVHVTEDFSGTALWLGPGRSMRRIPLSVSIQLLRRIYSSGGVSSMIRSMATAVYFDIHHIGKPHYYLHAIGVRQNTSGRGIGTRLLQAMLARCDREGVPAYLENSNIRNLDFYSKNGFEVVRKVRLPLGGPDIWCMIHRPRR